MSAGRPGDPTGGRPRGGIEWNLGTKRFRASSARRDGSFPACAGGSMTVVGRKPRPAFRTRGSAALRTHLFVVSRRTRPAAGRCSRGSSPPSSRPQKPKAPTAVIGRPGPQPFVSLERGCCQPESVRKVGLRGGDTTALPRRFLPDSGRSWPAVDARLLGLSTSGPGVSQARSTGGVLSMAERSGGRSSPAAGAGHRGRSAAPVCVPEILRPFFRKLCGLVSHPDRSQVRREASVSCVVHLVWRVGVRPDERHRQREARQGWQAPRKDPDQGWG
jgi:hypothetical protein